MKFDDWKNIDISELKLSETLLWDCDIKKFDFNKMKVFYVQRVIERGWEKDWYYAIHKCGGIGQFIDVVKQVPVLSDKDMNYVSKIFHIKLEDLKCYKHKQSRKIRFGF